MKIRIWRGYHSVELQKLIFDTWVDPDSLLILAPPSLSDLGFVSALPEGAVELTGDFSPASITRPGHAAWKNTSARPVFGVFTSGTASGEPRLVLYSRENIRSSHEAILGLFREIPIDTVFCYPQAFHTFGLCLGYVLAIDRGFKLVAPEGKYSSSFHEAWLNEKSRGKLTLATPTHLHDLLRFSRGRPIAASCSCILGGAPVTRELWLGARNELRIEKPSIGYGASEASPGVSHHPPGREPMEPSEIGFPFASLKTEIVEGQGLRFSGPSLCMAMVDGNELKFPSEALLKDDIEVRASDGMWIYRGRHELTLNRGGAKFSLERLEDSLRPLLRSELLCVALPDARLGQELGIALSGEGDTLAERELITRALRERYDTNFSPHVLRLPEFPRNASSKIDRKRIQEWMSQALSPS